MFVLDTNVVSELMRPAPHPVIASWVAERATSNLFGSGADRIVRAIRLRGALGRCGLCCHDVTPDHRGIRLP